jgi:tryptophan synthase alpha chain
MSRISGCFASLKSLNKCALIPYITAGDPAPEHTVGLMHTLVEAGADILELGVPFSDPMADGPVIQAACERALLHNTSLNDVLDMVTSFRQSNQTTPVILMGYLNPIERMGYSAFVSRAVSSGVDGVLTVDMPPEESHDLIENFRTSGIDPIYLLSPTSTMDRIRMIAEAASGFLYYVSLKGVTGAGNLDVDAVNNKLDIIRKITDLPVGVGFGINDAQSATDIARIADAVVVGSAFIRILETNQNDIETAKSKISTLLASMRNAIDTLRADMARQAG